MSPEEGIDSLPSSPCSKETLEEILRNELVTEPFGESNEGTSTQQATTAFPEEPGTSVDQTNVGLMDPTVSAASSLTPLGEGAPRGENSDTNLGLGDSLGPTTILPAFPLPQSSNMAAGAPLLPLGSPHLAAESLHSGLGRPRILPPAPAINVAAGAPLLPLGSPHLPVRNRLFSPTEDYPGQVSVDREFEQSGTAELVTFTESNEGTSTQQATTAFPEEPGSSVDQTNVGLMDLTVSAASSLTPLGEGNPGEENFAPAQGQRPCSSSRRVVRNVTSDTETESEDGDAPEPEEGRKSRKRSLPPDDDPRRDKRRREGPE